MIKKNLKLAIIGLGYVGLPLAVEFAKKRLVIGFDIKSKRIKELKSKIDTTLEVSKKDLIRAKKLILSDHLEDLHLANCFIIAVPTPIDKKNKPDLNPLIEASKLVGGVIKKGDIVIYESTVYPGCTEDECVPILEKYSGLKFNKDFYCGYSPERINPGDKKHRIQNIKKITSGSNKKIAKLIDDLYREIVLVGTHKAPSIRVAEAAKVIENTQRDLNIALMNELSILFTKLDLNTEDVLKAAGSKWNFLPFKPGLVGGHCIGVDPYYLTYKAKKVGYNPKIIIAGRELNDNMGKAVVKQLKKSMSVKKIQLKGSRILIMGLTFKENCPDLRNSGVSQIIKNLNKLDCNIDLYDPLVSRGDVLQVFGKNKINKLIKNFYDAVIIAVAHKEFKKMGIKLISKICKKNHIIYDLKNIFNSNETDLRL